MRRLLPWALLGLLGVGVVAGAAVGQADYPSLSPGQWVDGVLAATAAAGSAHLHFSTVGSSAEPTERAAESGSGVVDFTNGDFRITQVNHQIEYQSTNGGPQLPMAETWTEVVVAIGQTMYRDDSENLDGTSSRPFWERSHFPRDVHQAFGLDAGTDAENALAGLSGITPVAAVRTLGPDTVDGVRTTRYLVTDRPLQLCTSRPGQASHPISTALDPFLASALVPTTIWVDPAGRLVQAQLTTHISTQEWKAMRKLSGDSQLPTAPFTDVTTLQFSELGAPVHVAAPPVTGPPPRSFNIKGITTKGSGSIGSCGH